MTPIPPDEPRHGPDPAGSGVPPAPAYSYSGVPPAAPRNGLGIAALVLGILSLPGILTIVLGIILGLLAVIFGFIGQGRAKRGEATNYGMAIAGAVTGAIGLLVSVGFIAFGLSFFFSHKTQFNSYAQCLNHAHTQQARQSCANQFRHQLGR
jgi:hypothetical protein